MSGHRQGGALRYGITEKAVRLTAEYTRTRERSGPIAMFQAVGQRADELVGPIRFWNASGAGCR
jgi:alkylation response protein AidB-like acyl-CoA dehydrogenase